MAISSPTPDKNAYGTFIFKDGGYLPGLLMVAYSTRKNQMDNSRLVCLYTPDVCRVVTDLLKLLYDDVIPVEYLKFGRDRKGRQSPLPSMFTRFRFLEMTRFEKILVLDADMMPLKNYDSIFELEAPAGVINESKDHMKGSLKTSHKLKEWEWHTIYKNTALPGQPIKKAITDKPLKQPKDNMGINGGLMLLQPSVEDFKAFIKWCSQPNTSDTIDEMEWPDMQAITAYYSGKWMSIDAKYLGLYGYPNIASLSGIHFIGPKPWQHKHKNFEYRIKMYPDYRLWAEEYVKMCNEIPELLKYRPLESIYEKIKDTFENQ